MKLHLNISHLFSVLCSPLLFFLLNLHFAKLNIIFRVGITSDRRYLEPAGVNRRRERNDSSGRDNRSSRDDRRRREDTRTERRKGNKDLNVEERKYKGRNESRAERDRDREDDTRKNWSETGGARRENTLRDGQGEVRILYTGSRGAPFSGQKNIFDQRSSQQQTVSVGNEQSSSGKRRLSIENDRLTRYEGEKQDDYRKGKNKVPIFDFKKLALISLKFFLKCKAND